MVKHARTSFGTPPRIFLMMAMRKPDRGLDRNFRCKRKRVHNGVTGLARSREIASSKGGEGVLTRKPVAGLAALYMSGTSFNGTNVL